MAKTLEEFPVYHKAEAFAVAVNALLGRPAVGRNRRLRDPITEAADSMLANMSEGFEQPTDRAMGEEVGRMLGGWIRYLARGDWKDRGRHNLDAPSDQGSGIRD